VMGIADRFAEKDLKVFGPSAAAARIEGSKVFAKELMKKYNIPTGEYATFDDAASAKAYVKGKGALVVKADGLAAGKGVFVCKDEAEALHAIDQIMEQKAFGEAGNQVLIEEKLVGEEVSFLAFTDGKNILPMESVQDHKPAYDNDEGPNTGGMGCICPATNLKAETLKSIVKDIINPTISGLAAEGRKYRGLLYCGLMLTSEGPKVLEFNVRFGDPETQPLMLRMDGDLVPLLDAAARGGIEKVAAVGFRDPAVCVVLASGGYPRDYEKGKEISGLEALEGNANLVVFHAGTRRNDAGVFETAGGRVLGITARAETVAQAQQRAYAAVDRIHFDGMQLRRDIAARALDR